MATSDFRRFHELAEEFKGEMSLVKICEMEGVDYRSYISWRYRNGLYGRRRHHNGVDRIVLTLSNGGNDQDVNAMLELYAIEGHDTQNGVHDIQNNKDDTQNGSHDTQNNEDDTQNLSDLIKKNPKISKKELSKILGVSISTIGRKTTELNFVWIGPSRGGHWEKL